MSKTPPPDPLTANLPFSVRVPQGDTKPRKVCDTCGFIAYQNPKIVVGAVVSSAGKLLLCRRAIAPRRGYWTIPAGFLEEGETLEEGTRREVREGSRCRDRDQRASGRLFCSTFVAGADFLPGRPPKWICRRAGKPRGGALRLERRSVGGYCLSERTLGPKCAPRHDWQDGLRSVQQSVIIAPANPHARGHRRGARNRYRPDRSAATSATAASPERPMPQPECDGAATAPT